MLLCFVPPAVLSWVINLGLRKLGWVKDGDMKSDVLTPSQTKKGFRKTGRPFYLWYLVFPKIWKPR